MAVKGIAPTEDMVDEMEKALAERAENRGFVAISEIRADWDNCYTSNESEWFFVLFRDYEDNKG